MIKRRGDVFTTDAKAVGHGVNTVGVMGAGIAKTVRERFPDNYAKYRAACGFNALELGSCLMVKEHGTIIVNMATQGNPGPNATYDAVSKASIFAAERLMSRGIDTLAIPMIGCGIGGLEWPPVESILKTVEHFVPGFQFEVWRYQ